MKKISVFLISLLFCFFNVFAMEQEATEASDCKIGILAYAVVVDGVKILLGSDANDEWSIFEAYFSGDLKKEYVKNVFFDKTRGVFDPFVNNQNFNKFVKIMVQTSKECFNFNLFFVEVPFKNSCEIEQIIPLTPIQMSMSKYCWIDLAELEPNKRVKVYSEHEDRIKFFEDFRKILRDAAIWDILLKLRRHQDIENSLTDNLESTSCEPIQVALCVDDQNLVDQETFSCSYYNSEGYRNLLDVIDAWKLEVRNDNKNLF